MKHVCDEKECPHLGQQTFANMCGCHKTEVQMLREFIGDLKTTPGGSIVCPHCSLGFDPKAVLQHIRERH